MKWILLTTGGASLRMGGGGQKYRKFFTLACLGEGENFVFQQFLGPLKQPFLLQIMNKHV